MQHTRKCSALLAAGTGAAVCISGGGAQAAMSTGLFRDSNTGGTATGASDWKFTPPFMSARAFGIPFTLWGASEYIPGYLFIAGLQTSSVIMEIAGQTGGFVSLLDAGNVVDSALNWHSYVRIPTSFTFDGSSEKYFAVRFSGDSGTNWYYAWWRITYLSSIHVQVRNWGYQTDENTATQTLADSVTARKLGLSDGREKLVWSNANEEGVARYEVQVKDASGAWNAVSSEAPGAGMYSIAVPAGAECRVVVEKVDGSVENIGL